MAGASKYFSEVEDELEDVRPMMGEAQEPMEDETEPGDLMNSPELEQLELGIYSHAWCVFEDSKSQMYSKRQDWRRAYAKYRGKWEEPNEDSALKDLNIPKLAKICDLFKAKLMQMCIPDKNRMDFFELAPEETASASVGEDMLEQYAKLATTHVRHDLRKGNFCTHFMRNLLDLMVTGNMLGMPYYDQDIQYRFERVPNPEFDPMMPPEMQARITVVNGQEVETPIDPDIVIRKAHRAYDLPSYRYLNPRRVFPAEPDKHNYADCSAICITDTVIKADLMEDEIETGGYLYANLDKLKRSKEDSSVREVEDDSETLGSTMVSDVRANNPAARKFKRVTYIGRFDINEFCYGEDNDQQLISPDIKALFFKKFDVDPAKRTGWRNWIIEIVDEVLVRCQPVPFFRDAIPILHFGLFAIPNQTAADGLYDRAEKNESIFNAMNRYGLELTLKMVRPMYGVVRQYIDPTYWQLAGGKLDYAPHKMIPLMQGADVNKTIQTLDFNAAPLQATASAMAQEEKSMSEMTHFPNVKQGVQSGGNTATEVAAMSANADAMIDEIAQAIETDFLWPLVEWMLELHHQFTMEPKDVRDYDESAQLRDFNIPVDVWMHRYYVNVMGHRQTGNYAVKAQAFEKFVGLLERAGIANWPEIAMHWGKILQVPFGKRFITEPPPPPGPDVKYSVSLPLTPEMIAMMPPEAIGQLLMKMEIELSPEAQALLGVNADNLQTMQALQATAPQAGPSGGGRPSDANDGRNHHAPGEHMPSRGLGDEVGIQKSMSQRMRSPMGRAAAAV